MILMLALLVVLTAVGGTVLLYHSQQTSMGRVNHTLRVENRLSDMVARVQDAETSQRGYMLTREPAFLVPYKEAVRRWRTDLATLRAAVSDNPAQVADVDHLGRLIERRFALMQNGINDARARLLILPDAFRPGLIVSAQIRSTVATMKLREEELLARRSADAARLTIWVSVSLAISSALVILLGVMALMSARRRLQEAVISREALRGANLALLTEAADREAAEAQLRQMQKMESIGQLTGGIAHDFNNMLAIVIGSLDMAKRRLTPAADPRVGTGIDNAAEGAQRAAQLTARLLAFSRQQPLDPQPTDTNRLVSDMSELLRRTIGETIRVETVLAGGLWRASIDAGQLESAILNLCVNARDAMPDGGRLTIETANSHLDDAYAAAYGDVQAGQYVMVSVTDSGTGMPVEVVNRAFDPFFTTKGVGKGTGLGLSQVFGFVKQSHGHVKIYSEPGEGTTIKIYLPRHYGPDGEGKAYTAPDPTALPRANGEEVILVVEDEDRVRHMSVDSLRELGYIVLQASDAAQALRALAVQARIDLLFTDIVMPDMNGKTLSDRARVNRPDLKILFTTGYTRNAIVHNGILDPGVAFLAKPFTLDQLASKVREVLDSGTT
jgi:signal transduction histidine kinase